MTLPTPYYQDDAVTIFNADCREILPLLGPGSVDLVLTDPPYGVGFSSHGQLFRKASAMLGDESEELALWVAQAMDCPIAVFFSPYKPVIHYWRSILVWDKGGHVGIGGDRETCWKRDFELIGVANNKPLHGMRDSAVLRYPALHPPPSGHIAEKPEALMRYLVGKLSNEGETILDPFMGSGTTLRAAKDLGRKAIGIEIEERYCEIAAKRMAQGVLL